MTNDEKKKNARVAQPPSAVPPVAKPRPDRYRRNLPHYQSRGRPLFVTFVTKNRWILPNAVRSTVLDHCLHDHGVKLDVYCVVVMPDHVHMIYRPLTDTRGRTFGLAEVLGSIKSASSHSINRSLGRSGNVWQDETFDHVVRDGWLDSVFDYVIHNPVRKGLVEKPEDYEWLWMNPEYAEAILERLAARTALFGAPGKRDSR